MKILVIGADGMLGHQLTESLQARHEIVGTLRRPVSAYGDIAECLPARVHAGVDVQDFAAVARLLKAGRPDAVLNAAGIVKQRAESKQAIISLEVNALFPHR